MANTVTITQSADTPQYTTTHVYLLSDGSTGDLSNTIIQDCDLLAGGGTIDKIIKIQGCFNGFSGLIKFDQTTKFNAIVCPADRPFSFCFEPEEYHENPIQNPYGSGNTGDLLLDTTGFTAATDTGWFMITTLKKTTNSYSGG